MKNFYKYIFVILLPIGVYSCFSEKYEYRGEKRIINKEDWRVKFYQLDKFEMITPVRFEIVNKNDSLITGRHGLMGADSRLQNVDDYYAKIQDSILYICYPYPQVLAIKHISNINGSNQWGLIKKLQKQDTSLYLHPSYVIYEGTQTKKDK